MQRECAGYVNTRFAPGSTTLHAPSTPLGDEHRGVAAAWYSSDDIWPLVGGDSHKATKGKEIVDGVGIVELYAALRQGQSVRQWYIKHSDKLANIDLRRFITFGIIKGFLYRVQKYAFATGQPAPISQKDTSLARSGSVDLLSSPLPPVRAPSISISNNNSSSNNSYHQRAAEEAERERGSDDDVNVVSSAIDNNNNDDDDYDSLLEETGGLPARYLDGMHCFDQICTELEISVKELMSRLKRYPEEVQIIHR